MKTVIGMDLSLTATGLAEVQDGEVVTTYRVRSTGKKDDDLAARGERLESLSTQIIEWVMEGDDPDLVVIESPAYGAKFGSPHDRSGLWWLVVKNVLGLGFPIATVAPMSRAKYGTGRGNARKPDVLEAVKVNYGPFVASPYGIPDDNVADAILLAAMGARVLGEPVACEGQLPKAHVDAIDKMALPEGLKAA